MALPAVRLLIAFLVLAVAAGRAGAATATVDGAETLNMRRGPGREQPAVGTLTRGSEVSVERVDGDWVLVRSGSGTSGYVHRAFLRLTRGVTWDSVSTDTTPTPTSTTTPIGEEAAARPLAEGAEDIQGPAGQAAQAIEGVAEPPPLACGELRERLDRLLGLAEATQARLGGAPTATATQFNVDFARPPGAGPILAIAFAGALLGFVVGTLYGRRQERNRRTRVRL